MIRPNTTSFIFLTRDNEARQLEPQQFFLFKPYLVMADLTCKHRGGRPFDQIGRKH